MKYSVEIVYKTYYPTVQFIVEANNRAQAELKAKEQGKGMGFDGAVKKFVVKLLN